jgi:RNA polymerase sigma factor (sigma-70 family)
MNSRESVTNELLVLRAQTGDSDAMTQLVEHWQPRLWAFARVLMGDDESAWDVTQDVWLAAVRDLRCLQDPARFCPWIFRILRNKGADKIRRWQRQRRLLPEHAVNAGRETTPETSCVWELLCSLQKRIAAFWFFIISRALGTRNWPPFWVCRSER